MQPDKNRHEVQSTLPSTKKPYSKPLMEDYGSVVELTGSGPGTGSDGSGDPFAASGAGG